MRALLVTAVLALGLGGCSDDGGGADGAPVPPAPAQTPATLPAPDRPVPRDAGALAVDLTATTRRLRSAVTAWDTARPVPQDVELLALFHQRLFRALVADPRLRRATVARLPPDVRGEARDVLAARLAIAAIPRGPVRTIPRLRTAAPEPAATLEAAFRRGERRFGVRWTTLASVMFVESAFGRVRSASEAGARGPMQFLPATWRAYGLGGDIDDATDAILGAANLLRANGAPRDEARALFAYNRSTSYVRGIRRFARRMRTDPRTFRTFYAWQVYARTPRGVRRLTGPGRTSTLAAPRLGSSAG